MGIALGDYEARVQVAFDAGPFNASPTWTDITDDVLADEGLTFSRGARSVGGKPGPGLADLRVKNWAEDDRTNFAPYPSAESGATGWQSNANATVGTSAAWSYAGSSCYTLTSVAAGNASIKTSTTMATSPGAVSTHSVRLRSATASRTVRVLVLFFDSSYGFLSTATGSAFTSSTSSDVTPSIAATAPASAAWMQTVVAVYSTAAAGEVHYIDALLVEASGTVGTYFDGSTSGFEWTGAAHASTSRTAAIRRAGRWTPGVAAGPWHPLKLKRRIRLQARYAGGSWVDLWGGHLTDHTPSWIGAGKAVCDLSASDLLSALSLLKAFPNAILAEQLYDDPVLCYPLDDSEGSITAGDRTASNRPSLTVEQIGTGGAIDFGAGSVGPEGATCAAFTRVDASNGKYLALDAGVPTPFGATVAVVVLPSSASAQMTALAGVYEMFGSAITLGTSSTGKARASVSIPLEGISLTVVGTSTLATDDVSHLALTMSISGTTVTVTLYVNGAPEASGTFARGLVPNVQDLRVGGTAAGDVWDGQIANVAVYDTALSGARVTAHAAAVNGWRGEPSGYRFSRLALLAGIPGGLISTSSVGLATMGPQPVGGKTFTAALNEVAAAEQGAVDIDRSGLLRFAGRVLRRGAPSVVTLDARTDILSDFEGLPYNDEGLLNDVTVSRVGGATQRAVNAASALELGTISDSIEVYVEDDDQALSLAEWLANINAEPQLRAPVIKVSMAALAARSPSKVDAVMALERGQRITVSDLPDGLPATELDLFVEGVSDAWGKNDWIRTITTSSLWRNGAVWILGDPFYGVLGTSTILGH